MNIIRWLTTPDTPATNRKNFLNVEIDAVGIGLANAAAPFLPVFLTRLGASNFQVGLLTAMPAVTGFLLAIALGNFLQRQRNIVPWFSAARLLVVASYALTGLVTFFVPEDMAVIAILAVWAIATIPQTVVAIGFSVVMNEVAGPTGRFDLMSRRWSIMGFTTAISVVIVGQVLDRIGFPVNYQAVFIALSIGGLISYYYSSHINIPDREVAPRKAGLSLKQRIRDYTALILKEKPFISFTAKRFVFLTGTTLATPLFPLYYVREVHANDAWIGIFSTAQTAVLIVGYFFWLRQSRLRGNRRVLIWATLGLSIYPAVVALTLNEPLIALFAGLSAVFQAGIDLVFFDELMKTVPPEYSAVFVSLAQSLQYLSTVASPIIGTALAGPLGIGGALVVSAAIRFTGFLLFALEKPKAGEKEMARLVEEN
ncbi:MAG TPA: MFS transporter [Anaerolineaceae bacterium]|nr:MFS transporter [Anaerolineaceae bacterium]